MFLIFGASRPLRNLMDVILTAPVRCTGAEGADAAGECEAVCCTGWVATSGRGDEEAGSAEACALNCMLTQQLSMVFKQWQSVAAGMKHQEMLARKVLMQLVNAKLCAALGGWRSVAGERKRQAAAESWALTCMLK